MSKNEKSSHPKDDEFVCPECGAKLTAENMLCAFCGGKFEADGCGAIQKKKRMDSVVRRDVHEFLWDSISDKMEETPEGYLKGTACVTNIGIFPYVLDNGQIRYERRLPEDVFSEDSLSTLYMKPIANDHPKVAITADNYKALTVGSVGSRSYNDGLRVYAPIIIAEAQAVQDVKGGKIAFSCGYYCDVEEDGGTWLGVRYDVTQRNIRYNHLAIVQKGRAGDDAVMRMDGAGVCVSIHNVQENKKMAKLNLDGVDFEVAEVVASKHVELKQRIDKADADLLLAKTDMAKLTVDVSKITADRDVALEAKQKADQEIVVLKEKVDKAPAEIEAKIAARVSLVKVAQDCGFESTSEMSTLDIQKGIVLLASPKLDLASKDEVYIQARFDAAVEILAEDHRQDKANATAVAEGGVAKPLVMDAAASHNKMCADLESAYKNK